jgi:hypothetical protein
MRDVMAVAVAVLGLAGQSCSSTSAASGKTCTQLEDEYQQALSVAYECTPGAANQCQQAIPASFCAGCDVYVNDASSVNAIRAQLSSQGCVQCEGLVLCIQTGPWGCVATDGGGSGGQCEIVPAVPASN